MASDIAYSLIIDGPDGLVDRAQHKWEVDNQLDAPIAPEGSVERAEYERANWGLSPEAIRASESIPDEIPTYGEDET